MRRKLYYPFAILLTFLIGCTAETTNNEKDAVSGNVVVNDAHSYSNIKAIRTKHLHLEIDVDFERKKIYGVARHQMERLNDTDTAIFDINGPEIQKVTLGPKGKEKETSFIIGPSKEFIGQPLSVKIDKNTTQINIYYQTTDNAAAIDWLSPSLTAGKEHPYLYTQGEAVLTRTWIPVQCTPANRLTYSADVHVPAELMAVMSAKNPTKKSSDGHYHFEMTKPIPAYLIALAVGNLTYKKLGPNCGVYTEPEMIEAAAWEFTDLPKMITVAESLYGPYQWGQYDVLVLPYSFPFGGMENPMLTFANPTLIAGDKSAVSVIAHELAHSWSGNLVTNASWNDFWLNEGFTVYFENRIMEALYGKETADILALVEFQELEKEVARFKKEGKANDTKLFLDLSGRDPDDGMTTIAYTKGAFFLKTLERDFGRRKFDAFLKNYFKKYQFKTITTAEFERYLNKELIAQNNVRFNVKKWLYETGVPRTCYAIESPRFNKIKQLATDFANGKDIFKRPKKKRGKKREPALTRDLYVPQEWQLFIRALPSNLSVEKMALLNEKFHFNSWKNAEVATEWFVLSIKTGYYEPRPFMEEFLLLVGRRKFLLPIYEALANSKEGKQWATKVYKKARENYHPISIGTIDELLGFKE